MTNLTASTAAPDRGGVGSSTGISARQRGVTPTHLNVAQVCEELGIARSTFYDWRASHRAPRCIKLPNGAIRIRRRDLEAWLEAREEPA
jgi:predicted DNA-binding transcriptional regulator AlpA